MNFSSDAMADFEGLLEVNRKICKQQMAEKTLWQKLQQFDTKAETIPQTEAEQKHIIEQSNAYASALDSTSVWKLYQVAHAYKISMAVVGKFHGGVTPFR